MEQFRAHLTSQAWVQLPSLVACVLQWALARCSLSPRGEPVCWERKEMCCTPAGLLVWITWIATEIGKDICPAMETHVLWYMDENFGMMKATSLETYTTATATSMGPDALSHKLVWLCCGNTDSTDCCYFVETIWGQEVLQQSKSLLPGESWVSENHGRNTGEACHNRFPRVCVGMRNSQDTYSNFPPRKISKYINCATEALTDHRLMSDNVITEAGTQKHTLDKEFWDGVIRVFAPRVYKRALLLNKSFCDIAEWENLMLERK